MKILLYTHIFLWSVLTPIKLRESTLSLLANTENEKFLSAASAWEISIKYEKGSLILPDHPAVCLPSGIAAAGITALPIKFIDALSAAGLPPYHKDPFDRMLITQSKLYGIPILTDDAMMKKYDAEIIDI